MLYRSKPIEVHALHSDELTINKKSKVRSHSYGQHSLILHLTRTHSNLYPVALTILGMVIALQLNHNL